MFMKKMSLLIVLKSCNFQSIMSVAVISDEFYHPVSSINAVVLI